MHPNLKCFLWVRQESNLLSHRQQIVIGGVYDTPILPTISNHRFVTVYSVITVCPDSPTSARSHILRKEKQLSLHFTQFVINRKLWSAVSSPRKTISLVVAQFPLTCFFIRYQQSFTRFLFTTICSRTISPKHRVPSFDIYRKL